MTFKKLALASAIAALPMAAMAVDNLDDAMLGGVTGQDGIQIALDLNLTGLKTVVHDIDGVDGYAGTVGSTETFTYSPEVDMIANGEVANGVVTMNAGATAGGKYYLRTASAIAPAATTRAGVSGGAPFTQASGVAETFNYENAGAIVIDGTTVTANDVIVQIDAGAGKAYAGAVGTGTVNGVLNINVDLSQGATIVTGDISVANSNRDDGLLEWGYDNEAAAQSATLIESTTLTLGRTQLNIQLGNDEPQGNMIRVDSSITGGLQITGFAMNDVGGAVKGGAIGAGSIAVVDAGSGNSGTGNLTNVVIGIDVTGNDGNALTYNDGLMVSVLGMGNGGMDVFVERVYLGTTTLGYIGDIEMRGMNLAGTTLSLTGKP